MLAISLQQCLALAVGNTSTDQQIESADRIVDRPMGYHEATCASLLSSVGSSAQEAEP